MWNVLLAIGLLIILLITAAFYGAEKSRLIFNSIPLIVYWCVLFLLFTAGFLALPALSHKPPIFMIHIGCFLILAGSMWGSQTAHQICNQLFNRQKIAKGYMVIYEGSTENNLMTDFSRQKWELPFNIKLNDFNIEYYDADNGLSGAVKNYISDVTIIENGKASDNKIIKVNHPLRYGGYDIYQYSYDSQGRYTILLVTSNSGLYAVYAGYWILCLGLVWQLWFKNLSGRKTNEIVIK